MGERKRRATAAEPFEIPVSDNPEITQTTIFPTIDAMWLECIANHPALQDVSRARREMTKFAFYTGISEALRTIAFRLNTDQNESVFDDFGKELLAYDRELQQQASNYAAELN